MLCCIFYSLSWSLQVNLDQVKAKSLFHGLLLSAEMPENTELGPVSSGSGLCVYCKMLQVHQAAKWWRTIGFIAGTKLSCGNWGKLNISFFLNQNHWSSGWKHQSYHLAHGPILLSCCGQLIIYYEYKGQKWCNAFHGCKVPENEGAILLLMCVLCHNS